MSSRSFLAALEQIGADADRLVATFDEHDVRAIEPRPVTAADGTVADEVISATNDALRAAAELRAYVFTVVATDSRDARAQSLLSELDVVGARVVPLLARLADWVHALGADELATVSDAAREHIGPLLRLAERSAHQMGEAEEGLYAELATTGSQAWARLQSDVTSQLSTDVSFPDGRVERLPMTAVRGLATHADAGRPPGRLRRRAVGVAAGRRHGRRRAQRHQGRGQRRQPPAALGLPARGVAVRQRRRADRRSTPCSPPSSPRSPTSGLAAGQGRAPRPRRPAPAVVGPDRAAAGGAVGDLLGRGRGDRPLGVRRLQPPPRRARRPGARRALDRRRAARRQAGRRVLHVVRRRPLARAAQLVGQRRLGPDAGPRARATPTTTPRWPAARRCSAGCRWRWPRRPASSARRSSSRRACRQLAGADRLALLDVDLQGATQVVVDIHSRFLFETEVFARRHRRTLGVAELDELMLTAQADAYGDGLDQATAHPHMWAVKPHYYSPHFYNWPYTFGLLFGLGLFARYRDDPDRFRDRLRRPAVAGRDGDGRGAGRGVRHRRHRRVVLDRQPRRAARPHRRVRTARRGAARREHDDALRRRPRRSWASCSTASRATASTRCGRASTSASPPSRRADEPAQGAARAARRRAAAGPGAR